MFIHYGRMLKPNHTNHRDMAVLRSATQFVSTRRPGVQQLRDLLGEMIPHHIGSPAIICVTRIQSQHDFSEGCIGGAAGNLGDSWLPLRRCENTGAVAVGDHAQEG